MTDADGYVDLQVNGYAGVDFNDDELHVEGLRKACEQLREDGVAGILATIITDEVDVMSRRLATIAQLRAQDAAVREMIWGIHIEGPFISPAPGYVGAHPRHAVRPAELESMKRLLDAGDGLVRVVTLAPEFDERQQVTNHLARAGVRVAAGHCDPTRDQLQAAIDAGLSMFTHLGNGCPAQLARHDNIIQRVLSLADRLWISWIADGVHIPYPALGNYFRLAGLERCVIVTDAISAAGMGPGTFSISGRQVLVDELGATRYADDPSHLVGSAGTMPMAAKGLRQHLGLSSEAIGRLTRTAPREILSRPPS